MNPIVWPWLAEIGLISWRSFTGTHYVFTAGKSSKTTGVKRPPLPSEILASFIAFGAFAVIAEKDPKIGSLLGWGIVIATYMLMASSGEAVVPGAKATAPGSPAGTNPPLAPSGKRPQ